MRDPSPVAEGLAGHCRVVEKLARCRLADQFMCGEVVLDHAGIGELGNLPDAMDEHDPVEPPIDIGVADQAEKWSEARAGSDQKEIAAGLEIVSKQSARRLAPDEDGLARPDILEPEVSGPSGTLIERNSSSSS